jgi:hypothetical protein
VSTSISADELTSTRGERYLAGALAIFAAIGVLWVYAKLDNVGRPVYPTTSFGIPPGLTSDPAIDAQRAAQRRLETRQAQVRSARRGLELSREEYRTSLDAGSPAPNLEQRYRRAQSTFATANRQAAAAQQSVAATQPAADRASRRIEAEQRAISRDFEARSSRHRLLVFLARFALALSLLGLSFWMLRRFSRHRPRLVPLAGAAIATAVLLTLVFAGDYTTDYVNPLETGPVVLSLVGVAITLLTFMGLQRQVARRVPIRRVRRHECPFCGYPVGTGSHCEGCGRSVNGACASCSAPRRVGTAHCAACGAS